MSHETKHLGVADEERAKTRIRRQTDKIKMDAAMKQLLDTDQMKEIFARAFNTISYAWAEGGDDCPVMMSICNLVTDDGVARRSSMKSEDGYESSAYIIDDVLHIRINWIEAENVIQNGLENKVFYDWGESPSENMIRWTSKK